MTQEVAIQKSLELANRAQIATLGTNGDDGYPNIKAMFKMENEGLKAIWFSTNTSSKRVAQLNRNNKTCVYFTDLKTGQGLMLLGEMEILTDTKSRQRLWRKGFERYYPKGVNDSDYTVLRFTSSSGNYYHGLQNVTFKV